MKTDVVVVGSGAAGLSAALSAAARGAKVIVLERSSLFGGTTGISGGGMWVPNNFIQVEKGARDSAENALTYLRRLTLGFVSDELLESFVREAPRAIDFLRKETALQIVGAFADDLSPQLPGAAHWRTIGPGPYDTKRLGEFRERVRHPVWPGGIPAHTWDEMRAAQDRHDRWAWAPLVRERIATGIAARGHALVSALIEACLARNVELVLNTRAISLIHERGRVTGLTAVRDGASGTYEARLGVVLACGGFEWNDTMWRTLVRVPLDGRFSPPYNEGDGLRMAMRAGALLGGLQHAYFQPTVGLPAEMYEGRPYLRLDIRRLALPGSIAVDRRGRRFANEAGPSAQWVQAMTHFDAVTWSFPHMPAYLVFDRQNREDYPLLWEDWSFDVDGEARPDWVTEAPTIRELAGKIGVDPHGLDQQVREFNSNAERGVDPIYQRGAPELNTAQHGDERSANPVLRPLGPGPFYAYQLQLGAWGTRGGPVINGRAQVIDPDQHPIPGLYAAGNTIAAVTGASYPSGGATLGPAVAFGYIAGRSLTSG